MLPIVERHIRFNQEAHSYTDNLNNKYTSVTTVGDLYIDTFDVKTMARNCYLSGRKGNPKYAGKSAAMIEAEWTVTRETACDHGNEKHDYNDVAIKKANGYFTVVKKVTNRVYTLFDILTDPTFGEVDINALADTGFKEEYPTVYNIIDDLVSQGYRIYSELCVYNPSYLISGTIDLLCIRGNDCIIIDWKTNKGAIVFEAGYYEKDVRGEATTNFIRTGKTFKSPLSHVPGSVGHKYCLQVSGYGHLCACFGLNYLGAIIVHITHDVYTVADVCPSIGINMIGKTKVNMIPSIDLTNEAESMYTHFMNKNMSVRKTQLTMAI